MSGCGGEVDECHKKLSKLEREVFIVEGELVIPVLLFGSSPSGLSIKTGVCQLVEGVVDSDVRLPVVAVKDDDLGEDTIASSGGGVVMTTPSDAPLAVETGDSDVEVFHHGVNLPNRIPESS